MVWEKPQHKEIQKLNPCNFYFSLNVLKVCLWESYAMDVTLTAEKKVG